VRDFGEVLLVIVLGEVKFWRVDDFSGDGAEASGCKCFAEYFLRRFSRGTLLGAVDIDA
jgi:hypothetical protein